MMTAHTMRIVDAFDDAQAVLRKENHVPLSMADTYREIAKRLDVDFSASIRLLDALPVFLHGDRHKTLRKQMATRMAAQRNAHEMGARAFIEALETQTPDNKPFELIVTWLHPLWRCMHSLDTPADDDLFHFIASAPQLFNMKCTLRERLRINAWIERFIATDASTADERLIHLGQSVLGFTPLMNTLAMSLHHVFSSNLNQLLNGIEYPAQYPSSAVQTTDRHEQLPSGDATVMRCVLHSPHRTAEQNNAMLYGAGEHVCLGRPLANEVWRMLVGKLSCMPHRVTNTTLQMERPSPASEEDYLHIIEPFQRPVSLWVTLST